MALSPTPPLQTSARTEWLLLHLSFILIGVITTLLGPILPSFSHHWSLTDAQAGFFFTAQYLGSTLGVALTSYFIPRFGFSKVTAGGFIAFLVGFAFLGLGPWVISSLMASIIGFGYGLANPAINLRSTQLPSKSTAAAVTFLNFSWSIGSVLCPFLVGALIPSIGLRYFSVLLAAFSLVFVALHFSVRAAPATAKRARATHPLADWLAHLRLPRAIPLLLLFFLYVGTEVALGGWVATFEKRMPGMSTLTLVIAPSVFYGSLLFGRGISPLALRHRSQVLVSTVGLSLGTAAIAGFGLAPQYPIFITWLAAIFRDDSTWIGALFFGAAGIGGGVLPWLVGIVSSSSHSLRAGLCLPLAVSFLMIFLAFQARPQTQPA
jgi:MFS transporter, FHS family, glucose/mannose:H+ symporter